MKAGIRHPLFREPLIPMVKPYKWYGCSYYWGWLEDGFCSVDGGCIGYMYALCGWLVLTSPRGLRDKLSWMLKHVVLLIAVSVFYLYGAIWLLKRPRVDSMEELYRVFYIDFLRLKPGHVEVVKLTDRELVTISRNPCPILKLSLALGMDTRYTCKLVSETVCRFVLKHIDEDLEFERDYSHIRPYKDGCLERIYLKSHTPSIQQH